MKKVEKMFKMRIILLLAVMISAASCTTHQAVVQTSPAKPSAVNSYLPKARIYKVQPRWADHVAVTMSNGKLISYPGPGDISAATSPLSLSGGWYLDRQGIGPSSVFLKWTREQYARLAAVPSVAEILANVEPGSGVSEIYELPMSSSQAAADTAAVNKLIADGLPGCKSLMPVFHLNQK